MQMMAERISEPTSPTVDILVHLGAGLCSELDDYLARQARQLILVEADPEIAESLARRTADRAEVQVICAAVAEEAGTGTFHRYNLSEAGSLRAATGLHALYPGLKLLEEVPVETVRADRLLESLTLEADRDNLLVVDIPGEELPALEALGNANLLHMFREVRLYCGQSSLYTDSAPAERVLRWLSDEGFDLVSEDDSRDPDRPVWTLQRNTLMLRNRELRRQLEELVNVNANLETLATDRQRQIEILTRAREEQAQLLDDFRQQLEQAVQQRDAGDKRAAQLEQQIQVLATERDQKAQRVAELTTQHDEREKVLEAKQAELQQRTKTQEQKAQLAMEWQQRYEQARSQLEASAAHHAELEKRLADIAAERDATAKLAGDRAQELDALKRDHGELGKLAAARLAKLDEVQKALDAQTNNFKDLQTQLAQVKLARDAEAKKVQEQAKQIEELARSRADLVKRSNDLAKRVADLETERADTRIRQDLLGQEMIRTEAQIDLIKDVLLRDIGI